MALIYGIHPVAEALKARGRSIHYVAIARERQDTRVHQIVKQCRELGIPVRQVSRDELMRLAQSGQHQGVVAVLAEKQYSGLEEILAARRGQHVFLLVLDGIEDPHNLGAILRSADAAGADGIVIPERRAAGVTATAVKASAGASEHIPVARVGNVNRALEELKSSNIWIVGLDERGTQSYDEIDYGMDCALVLGAEGKGLHDLVRRHCDFLVRIPMQGRVASLNVSVAAGIVAFEVARQRRRRAKAGSAAKMRK
jgi:23S rRNA (guanosine2251-2'-O)-methyltransferase